MLALKVMNPFRCSYKSHLTATLTRNISVAAAVRKKKYCTAFLPNASNKGKDKLFDNIGFSYNIKKKTEKYVIWKCSVRNTTKVCPAKVRQEGDYFSRNEKEHVHQPKFGSKDAKVAMLKAKQEGLVNPFKPASLLVRNSVREKVPSPAACEALPRMRNMEKAVNYFRRKKRPKEPTNKDFELDINHIPADFLLEDLHLNGERHILFATKKQLQLLSKAKTWYVDATFKIVKKPFKQLFSIHAFVKRNEEVVQFPLLFCLMSARTTVDYKAILDVILNRFERPPKISQVILDFERAVWNCFEEVLPDVELRGCSFHFCQAILRQTQSLGLQTQYRQGASVKRYVRKLMGLCFLAEDDIERMFSVIKCKARSGAIAQLTEYFEKTWIKGRGSWKPSQWSVFGLAVRTNNNVEGWHACMNKRGRKDTPFYLLIQLLDEEASDMALGVELLDYNLLSRRRRRHYVELHNRLCRYWNEYRHGERSAMSLLRACSRLTCSMNDA